MKKLRYIDTRKVSMNLRSHGGRFVTLPFDGKETIIDVTDREYDTLLKRRNGTRPCFEPVQEQRRRAAATEE